MNEAKEPPAQEEHIESTYRIRSCDNKGGAMAFHSRVRVIETVGGRQRQPLQNLPLFLRRESKHGRVELWRNKNGSELFERIGDSNELRRVEPSH